MPVVHTLKRAARLRYFIHEGLNIRLARASVIEPALILAHQTFTQDSSHVLQRRGFSYLTIYYSCASKSATTAEIVAKPRLRLFAIYPRLGITTPTRALNKKIMGRRY